MSKFMIGLNNDIPSPVEEGVVDNIKNFFSRNKAVLVDPSAIKKDINAALQVISSLAKSSEFKTLAKGLYKVTSGSMEVFDNAHKIIGNLNNKQFAETYVKAGQWLHINIGEIQFSKVFPNKDRLDRSPEAERGDLSPEGKEFDKIVNAFEKTLAEKAKNDKYNICIEWQGDWDDEDYTIVFDFMPRNYVKDDGSGMKESYELSSEKEAVQEELFPILTGEELPVKEMSDNAAEALAVASAIGLVGLGMGLFSLVNKGIDKVFGNKKSSGSTKINRQSADKLKKLGKEFMDTQSIDANERRSAFNDAIKLLKQYYPKEYIKQHFGISLIGGEWNEPSDFYKGKINICDFAFIHSASQEIPGYEEIRKKNLPEDEEDEQREAAKNKYHKTIREMLNSINKDLTKKYKGKYRVYCEEFDDYWDIYGEGDGDEGVLIIADVDIISRMKSYVKNHVVEESFTEITTEATDDYDVAAKDIIEDAKANNNITPELLKERKEAIRVAKQLVKRFFPAKFKSLLDDEKYTQDYYTPYSDYTGYDFLKHKIMGSELIGSMSIRLDYDPSDTFSNDEIKKKFVPAIKKAEADINKELQKKFKKFKIAFEYLHENIFSAERDYVSYISLIDKRYCNINCSFRAGIDEIFNSLHKASVKAYEKARRKEENDKKKAEADAIGKDNINARLAERNKVFSYLLPKAEAAFKKAYPTEIIKSLVSGSPEQKFFSDFKIDECLIAGVRDRQLAEKLFYNLPKEYLPILAEDLGCDVDTNGMPHTEIANKNATKNKQLPHTIYQAMCRVILPKYTKEIGLMLKQEVSKFKNFDVYVDNVSAHLIDRTYSTRYGNYRPFNESTEVVSEDAFTKVAALAIIGGLMFKGYKDKKKNLEEAEKRQAEARAKEIAEYAKKSNYIAKHPVNSKERKAVLAEAKKLLSNKNFNFYKSSYFEQQGDEKIFTGESKDADALNICCIDLCGLYHPDQLDDMDPDEWCDGLTTEISDANKELHKKFNKRYVLEEEDYTILLVDTVYRAGLLNVVKENYTPFIDEYTAALEGWGVAFTRFAVKHNLPFANKLEDKIWEWSESTVNQLTNVPEFKEYVLREAPKVYDEAYLKNNRLSLTVTTDMISEFEEEYENKEEYDKVDKKTCCFCKKIGKFYIGVFGDKSHIHGVWLLMSDSKNKKIYAKALPAPEKELNKFKYQKY